MTRVYVNNFRAALASAITSGATAATLTTATGLPTLTGSDYYYLTIDGGNGTYEIVKVTARASTAITIVRAQESTTAIAWAAGAVVELRATASTYVDIEADTRDWNTQGYMAVGGGTSVSSMRFLEAAANGTNYVGFQAPATLAANKLWVLPSADGSANQVIKTDGSGTLSFTTITTGIATVSADTTPALGGNLTVDGYSIISASNGNISLVPNGTGAIVVGGGTTQTDFRLMEASANGTNYTGFKAPASLASNVMYTMPSADGTANYFLQTNGSGQLGWAAASGGSGIASVSADTTPALGGDLNVAAHKITSVSNGDVQIQPDGTGALLIGGGTSVTEARFLEPSGTGSTYVGFKSPASITTSKIWTLPNADGTTGQVLKTDGSGALGWVTAGGSSALTFIASATASSSATIDFTSLGGYSKLIFVLDAIVPANSGGERVQMRLSSNGGTTYDATSGNYRYSNNVLLSSNTAANSASTAGAGFVIGGSAGTASGAGYGIDATLDLHNYTSTTDYKKLTGNFMTYDNNGVWGGGYFAGANWNYTAAVNAVRFLMTAGNIASGTIYVYGVSKT